MQNTVKFRFLTINDVLKIGDSDERLDIFKQNDIFAKVTDFAKLLECFYSDWYTYTLNEYGDVGIINSDEIIGLPRKEVLFKAPCHAYHSGARPAFDFKDISLDDYKVISETDKVMEISYGEYPQTAEDENLSVELGRAYAHNRLIDTGKYYTTNDINTLEISRKICTQPVTNHSSIFKPKKNIEYEYNGNRYIRYLGYANPSYKKLSNGQIIKENLPYWIKVEPIIWLVDKKANIAVSKDILFSGIPFDYRPRLDNSLSDKELLIVQFMDTFLADEIRINKKINHKIKLNQNLEGIFSLVSTENYINEINQKIIDANKFITKKDFLSISNDINNQLAKLISIKDKKQFDLEYEKLKKYWLYINELLTVIKIQKDNNLNIGNTEDEQQKKYTKNRNLLV